jgi:hypothetical protein
MNTVETPFGPVDVTPEKVDQARARLLFNGHAQTAAMVFLALWKAGSTGLDTKTICGGIPGPKQRSCAHWVWQRVDYLEKVAKSRSWPMSFKWSGQRISIVLLDASWDWMKLVSDTAVLAHLRFPKVDLQAARALGELLDNFGQLTSITQIGKTIERTVGFKTTHAAIQRTIGLWRKEFLSQAVPLTISTVVEVGYKVERTAQTEATSDRFGFVIRQGILDVERIGAACTFLGKATSSIGLIFLILWDRRNEVVAYDAIYRIWDEYVGEFHERADIHQKVRLMRSACRQARLGIDIRSIRNVGYQLTTSQDFCPLDPVSLRRRSELTYWERVAQLATRMPHTRTSVPMVLQFLRDRSGGYLSFDDLIDLNFREHGVIISKCAVKDRISRARKALLAAGAPITIGHHGLDDGYCLQGDINAWLAGEAQPEPQSFASPGPNREVELSRKAPAYRSHYHRSYHGFS